MNGPLPDTPLLDCTRYAPSLHHSVRQVTPYTREEALDILAPGGWLNDIYGPIEEAPLLWLQTVATNVVHEPICPMFQEKP